MRIEEIFSKSAEKPLDNIVFDGGFARVFRTIGCIGDSLSSGEYESNDGNGNRGYHDFYEYSWGQYIARNAGINVYNFSRGGMTAKWFMDSFGDSCGIWTDEKKCQAYIIALGVNDLKSIEIGTADDIDVNNYKNNRPTFAGYYAQIISRLKALQQDAKFFLVTMPRGDRDEVEPHAALLRDIADKFDNTYVLELNKYSPDYSDPEFINSFFCGGHMNAAGYILTAQMITSYMDYIVRHNFKDFSQVGFIGTPYRNLADIKK